MRRGRRSLAAPGSGRALARRGGIATRLARTASRARASATRAARNAQQIDAVGAAQSPSRASASVTSPRVTGQPRAGDLPEMTQCRSAPRRCAHPADR